MRYQWVQTWPQQIDLTELEELLTDAWAMCVPKSISAPYGERSGSASKV